MRASRQRADHADLIARVAEQAAGPEAADKHAVACAIHVINVQLIAKRRSFGPARQERRRLKAVDGFCDVQAPGKPLFVEVESQNGIVTGRGNIEAAFVPMYFVTVFQIRRLKGRQLFELRAVDK